MKYPGCILEFTHDRNADILRVLRTLRLDKDVLSHGVSELAHRIAESPSARFWISEDRATVIISAMLKGKPLPPARQCRREMYEEIYRRVVELREKRPDAQLQDLVTEVVNQPAPKFYLTPNTIARYIYRVNSNWYDRQPNRYRQFSC